MHTLYLGPSWAVQSFESPGGEHDPVKTNLAQELGLTDYTSLALYANSNFDQLTLAQEFIQQHPELAPFRIVFVSANSLSYGHKIFNMSRVEFAKTFLQSNDPLDLVQSLEQQFYQRLNQLGVPVALIGAHTDVTCQSHDNITVIHPSWQNFLAQRCGLNSVYGWAADVAHGWLQGIVIPEVGDPEHFDLGRNPSPVVVDEIHKIIFDTWMELEKHKLFRCVHPNILGNQLFAKEIADSFNQWIDNVV
jgi:hypothetical protein